MPTVLTEKERNRRIRAMIAQIGGVCDNAMDRDLTYPEQERVNYLLEQIKEIEREYEGGSQNVPLSQVEFAPDWGTSRKAK